MKQILFFLALFLASLPAVAQPTITQPPANQAVALGGTLTLGVMAGGAAPAYQWFKDSRLILGATNSTLTVLNAGVTNSGTYYVVVTNMGGMVISLPALVAVGSPSLSAWGYNSNGQLGNGTTSNTNLPIIVASNVVAGAGGNAYSLFVKTDGTLSAMGYNFFGQLGNGTSRDAHTPINVASNVVAVAAGQDHSLFVKTNGTLWAMGLNANGQLGNGTINNAYTPISVASNVVFVAAGYEHSLFVTADGTLWAMGYNGYGQLGNGTTNDAHTPVSVASNVVAAAAGYLHSLFVTADGTLWAMGLNLYGQLGNGTTSGLNPNPTPINVASNVVAAVAGDDDSLFVTTDGTLWAMGWNNVGQLGNGTTINTSLPVSVASNVVAVAAGQFHSLFETTAGTLCVMGRNNYGQLGNGTTNNSSLPVSVPQMSVANIFPVDQATHSLAIGFSKALATVMLLGNLNQTYTGSAISVTADTVPPGLTVNLTYNGSPNAPTNPGSYTVIGTISDPNYYGSAMNTLVINPNATVTLGNLNQAYTGSAVNVTASTTPPGLTVNLTYNGSTNEPTSPGSYTVIGAISTPNYYGVATNTLVITGPTVAPAGQVLAVGGAVTLGVTVSNMAPAYQWFKDSRLILGATNSTLTVLNAGVPNSGTYYVVITNGNGMAISLPASVAVGNPSLLAWGYNDRGQLGNGTTTDDYTPISVASNVVAGAAGGHHSLFVDTNGILWAMGWNASGQLGTGTTISTNLPVSVASNVVAVAAGLYHSLFVKTDGTLWAMGYNNSGQLGNGTTTDAHTPINVAINVVAAAAGYYHSLFVKSDGTLWAMGNNSYGELGNGTTSNTNLPVSVASNVVAVAAGYYHSLFVKTDGTLWAMGYNNYGQLGNGTTIYYTNWPVSVAINRLYGL
jgi:YD repeat-containing protein